ncbi:Zn(II)2Cys6 transcription factor [Penicillium argentinense]|uniref:Zn(II)2Cys6 transcription factor n=1 Tax=Penicillium argentinense TaxID=1131581 RepID=A0A9W9JXM6_9EURO|nr:Zn(II)2Cys6 transcription factor [Penicillium argentinense]KAJ5085363.1 Zn(II)2Cys6 transcription factor [Penicillium argentinense]
MANSLFPGLSDGKDSTKKAYEILDEMIGRGNRVAEVRKLELLGLKRLFGELAASVEERGLRTLTLLDPKDMLGPSTGMMNDGSQLPVMPCTDPEGMGQSLNGQDNSSFVKSDPQLLCDAEFLDNIGISSSEFLSIIDQMGYSDL